MAQTYGEYKFLYETHLHTNQGSACAHNTGAEMAAAAKAWGYAGINATHSNSRSTSHNDPAYDERAIAYAAKHGLPLTAGSDTHTTKLLGGGVLSRRRLRDVQDYIACIRAGDYLLTNGEKVYDRFGCEVRGKEEEG